jgi:hypothetical protein
MLTRVAAAIDERLTLAQAVATRLLPEADKMRAARRARGREQWAAADLICGSSRAAAQDM